MHAHYIQLLSNIYKIDAWIKNNLKYGLYFEDCLGALDGTYIPTQVSYINQILYQNQKSFFS